MNMNDYTALQIHKYREHEVEAERKHQEQVKEAKANKALWRSLTSKRRK